MYNNDSGFHCTKTTLHIEPGTYLVDVALVTRVYMFMHIVHV